MEMRTYITLGFTFIMGLFCGVYLYVTVYAPQHKADDVEEKSSIIVSGEIYGGCARTGSCASFRFTENKQYQYFESKDSDKDSGILPNEVAEKVFQQLAVSNLQTLASSRAIRDCISYVDGNDYRYMITFNDNNYVLDTCATNFPGDGSLQRALLNTWEYIQNPTTTYPVIIEEGVGGFLIDRFRNPD